MNLLLFLAVSTWRVARGAGHVEGTIPEQIQFSFDLYPAIAHAEKGFFAVSPTNVIVSLTELHDVAGGLSRAQLCDILHCPLECSEITESGLRQLVNRTRGGENSWKPLTIPSDMAVKRKIEFNLEQFSTKYSVVTLELTLTSDFKKLNKKPPRHTGAWMENRNFCPYKWSIEAPFFHEISSTNGKTLQRVRYWHERTGEQLLYELARNVWIPKPLKQWFEADESMVLASAAMFVQTFDIPLFIVKGFIRPFFTSDYDTHYSCSYFTSIALVNYGELRYLRANRRETASSYYIGIMSKNEFTNNIKTYIILPHKKGSIHELEHRIKKPEIIREMLSNEKQSWVSLTLPEYMNISSQYNLVETLEYMNLKRVFDETNDFENITKSHPVKVGSVLQQVRLQYKLLPDSARQQSASLWNSYPIPQFEADHPFIFVTLYMDESPSILSMGRYGLIPHIPWQAKYSDENINENLFPHSRQLSP